mgnify:CR=1 FL=1
MPTAIFNTGLFRIAAFALTVSGLAVSLYGVLAIDAGQRLIQESYFIDRDELYLERHSLRAQVNLGNKIESSSQPWWTQLLSQITSQRHIYGDDSYFTTHLYLAKMPSVDALVLGIHATLAGICMVFGFIQFIPAARKHYPLWHRRMGKAFVAFGLLSMLLSMVYLLKTPPQDTYGGLTFHVGLWMLAISASFALFMAVFHIRKRQVAQHQVYMALAYGLMLTAPLLRYDWMILGSLWHQQLSFNEINYAVNVMLIPQSFLLAYVLVLFTRWSQKSPLVTPTKQALNISAKWITASIVFSVMCMITLMSHYIGDLAANLSGLQYLIPPSVLNHHAEATNGSPVSRFIFLFSSCTALFAFPLALISSGLRLKHSNFTAMYNLSSWSFALTTLVSGAVLLYWAWLLDMPTHLTASAGAGYLISGIPCIIFGLLLFYALLKGSVSYFFEWAVFALLFVASPAMFFWALNIFNIIGLPQLYIDQGHGYTIASAMGPIVAMLAFFNVAYGQASVGHKK